MRIISFFLQQGRTRQQCQWQTLNSANQWIHRTSARACLCTTKPSSRIPGLWLTCQTSAQARVSYFFLPPFQIHSTKDIFCTSCTQFLSYQLWSLWPLSDPVSRKSIKSAHSSRNRYSSQWTLSRPSQSQSTASARTLTSDWRTMGSHGITATESDSYSASLSQDTGG